MPGDLEDQCDGPSFVAKLELVSPEEFIPSITIDFDEGVINKSRLIIFKDPELFKLYQSNQRKKFDYMLVLPVVLIVYISAVTRSNLENAASEGPIFSWAFFMFLLVTVTGLPYVAARMLVRYTPIDEQRRPMYQMILRLLTLCFSYRIEDVVGITGTISVGLYLLARVYAGQ